MKRLYINPQTGQQLVYYDDPRTDPLGWWKNVQIPGQRRHWPWWAWMLIVLGLVLLPFALLFLAGILIMKLAVAAGGGPRRRRW